MEFNIQRIRNKDHDLMMDYIEADSAPMHAAYAWHYHSNRAAKYIKKLEKMIVELKRTKNEKV